MDAHQIVPCEAPPNPEELVLETFLRTPDRIPTVNPETETVSDPQKTGLVVVPDADDPMTWNLEFFFTDCDQYLVTGSNHDEGTATTVGVDYTGGCVRHNCESNKGKAKEKLGLNGGKSQGQSKDRYFKGETSTPCVPAIEAQVWRPSNCLCCQVLREIVHSDGEMVTTKLEIHGRVGVICHAILEHRHCFPGRPAESLFQFIDYGNKCLEEVKHSLEEYCDGKEREGFFVEQDSLSMFYETVCVGYDWNENLEDHSPTGFLTLHPALPLPLMQQPPQQEENEGGKPPKTNLSQQRERASKLKYKDLADYFDYPIQEAAQLLNLCPTVLKKICRQEGVPRWPYRKVKSLKKQMEKVREFMNSNVYTVEQYASLQESLNRLQRDLDFTVAGGKKC